MDDLNLLSNSVKGTQDLLERCTKALTWLGMSFRPGKSRSIVILKGKSINCIPFSLPNENDTAVTFIPTIHSRPVKFLGRIIDGSLTDRKSIDELQKKLLQGLSIIDKSFFTGVQKVWILQHLLIPRIQWALLIYEVSFTLVSTLQQKVSVYIRKWLEGLRNVTYRHWSSCTGCSPRLGRLCPRRRWSYRRTEAGCPCRRTGGALCGLASRLLLALVPFLNFNLN